MRAVSYRSRWCLLARCMCVVNYFHAFATPKRLFRLCYFLLLLFSEFIFSSLSHTHTHKKHAHTSIKHTFIVLFLLSSRFRIRYPTCGIILLWMANSHIPPIYSALYSICYTLKRNMGRTSHTSF